MPFVVVLVLDNVSLCPELLHVWEEAGVPGATVLESTGLHRLSKLRDDLPLIPSARNFLENREFPHRTIFAVVPDEPALDRVVKATRSLIDFSAPNSGVLFVLPAAQVYGLEGKAKP